MNSRKFLSKYSKIAFFCALVFLAIFNSVVENASAKDNNLPDIPYLVVDMTTNTVLEENRIFERWHPASLTKLMTAYVTFRAIAKSEVANGSPVTITKNARKAPPSKMGYATGVKLRVDTALRILIVKSANDVALALAESIAGNVDAFVGRMNAEAARLGMHDSRFSNPNGLHDNNQFVSARDLVVLSRAIWNEFPQYRELFKTPSITTGKKTYYSYNFLLERFAGTTGMKTGFVCASGYNIVASAERDNRQLVSVVLGSASQTQRAEVAARLLLIGFNRASGTELSGLARPENSVGPTNMRPVLCTEKARKSRYDPAAENAFIKSDYLEKRKITRKAVLVNLGGIDAPPSDAWLERAFIVSNPPKPIKRPDYVVVNVDGEILKNFNMLRGTIAIPSRRPVQ